MKSNPPPADSSKSGKPEAMGVVERRSRAMGAEGAAVGRTTIRAGREIWPWLALAGSVALLVLLAALQFHWLEQVAEADRQRTAAAVRNAADRLAQDFNSELAALFLDFQGVPRSPDRDLESLARSARQSAEQWAARSTWPELLGGVYILLPPQEGAFGDPRLKGSKPGVSSSWPATGDPDDSEPSNGSWGAFRVAMDRFEQPFVAVSAAEMPVLAAVEHLRQSSSRHRWRALAGQVSADPADASRADASRADAEPVPSARIRGPRSGAAPMTEGVSEEAVDRRRPARKERDTRLLRDRRQSPEAFDLLVPEIPGLLLPIPTSTSRRFAPRGPGLRRGVDPEGKAGALVVVVLDRAFLFDDFLPELVERHFGAVPELHLEVVGKVRPWDGPDGPADPSSAEILLFETGPAAPGAGIEVEAPLFGPLRLGEGERTWRRHRLKALAGVGGMAGGRWRLIVRHPAGSLDAAVARTQQRNMTVVLGILTVLGTALWVLAAASGRSARLARQQLDFVAGVTHELMTPLAAMRSAGQNLADGVVSEPQQVGRYGRMIDQESRRLAELIQQVLAFARMQSGQPHLSLMALDPAEQAGAAARELQPILEAEGARLEMEIADDLPLILGDAEALRRCLSNLVVNAIKYGQIEGQPRWVGLEVRQGKGPGSRESRERVYFQVRDRGPGIDPRDRDRLLEPFYRGQGLAASAIPGSGLGLALVEHLVRAQGGGVEVASAPIPSGRSDEARAEEPTGTLASIWLPTAGEKS